MEVKGQEGGRAVALAETWPGIRGFVMEEYRAVGAGPTLKTLIDAYERRIIEDALRSSGGNQRRAARALGVLPTTLHEKMKRLGLIRRNEILGEEPIAIAV